MCAKFWISYTTLADDYRIWLVIFSSFIWQSSVMYLSFVSFSNHWCPKWFQTTIFLKFKTKLHAQTVHLCFHFYTCKYISWYHYFFQEAAWSGKEANFWLAVTEVCHSALPITVFVLCVIDEHLFGLLFSCDSYAYYSYCTTNKNTVSFSWN